MGGEKIMTMFNCTCKCSCTIAAVVSAIIIGVVTAFLHVTAVVTATPAFLWVVLGIAAVYLGITLLAAALRKCKERELCLCSSVNTLLAGILGTVLFSIVLLAVGVVATSILSAILVGVLMFFFTLAIAGTACLVRSLFGCEG